MATTGTGMVIRTATRLAMGLDTNNPPLSEQAAARLPGAAAELWWPTKLQCRPRRQLTCELRHAGSIQTVPTAAEAPTALLSCKSLVRTAADLSKEAATCFAALAFELVNDRLAARRSAVSKPSVNPSSTDRREARASSPVDDARAMLMAVRNSQDRAFCSRAQCSECAKSCFAAAIASASPCWISSSPRMRSSSGDTSAPPCALRAPTSDRWHQAHR